MYATIVGFIVGSWFRGRLLRKGHRSLCTSSGPHLLSCLARTVSVRSRSLCNFSPGRLMPWWVCFLTQPTVDTLNPP